MTATLTPSVCAVPVWKELLPDDVTPLSNTWTLRSGPERPPATNDRWTGPNVAFVLARVAVPGRAAVFAVIHVPEVCSQVQFSSTVCGPPTAIGRPPVDVQVTSPTVPPGASE